MKRNLTLIVVIGLLGACSGEVQAPDEHGGTAFQPSTPVVEKPDLDLEAIARLPVQSGQRYQPFDTFAKVAVRAITGKNKFHDTDPKLLYLQWRFEPEKAVNGRFIKLPSVAVSKAFDLEVSKPGVTHTSLALVSTWDKFFDVHLQTLEDKKEKRIKLTDEEAGLRSFASRVSHLSSLCGRHARAPDQPARFGAYLPIIPPEADPVPGELWRYDDALGQGSGWPPEKLAPVVTAMNDLRAAYLADDGPGFTIASKALLASSAALGPERDEMFRGMDMIDREVRLSDLSPFSVLRFLYFFGFFLAILVIPFRNRAALAAPIIAIVGALAYHVWALVERTVIAQRAMIGNLYESALFMAAAAVAIAIVFELVWAWRARARADATEPDARPTSGWFLAAGSLVAMLLLFWAQGNPSFWNPEISTLQPVLINNSLIHIHVPTIMASYAVLALTVILAHVYLITWLIQGTSTDALKQASLRRIANSMFWTIPVGVITLFAGIVLGGVWADASWGRFWGWDPKETASLVTWIAFVIIVHGRWAGWLRDVGTATGSVFGGLALLWTYWGANFVQQGLHSYAGSGADIPQWPIYYGAVELVLLVTTLIVWNARKNNPNVGHRPLPPDGVDPGDE